VRGSRKRSHAFGAALAAAPAEKIAVNENGRSRRITKPEAVAKQLANRAASGDSARDAARRPPPRSRPNAAASATPSSSASWCAEYGRRHDAGAMAGVQAPAEGAGVAPQPIVDRSRDRQALFILSTSACRRDLISSAGAP
jgi:hypothetical protein